MRGVGRKDIVILPWSGIVAIEGHLQFERVKNPFPFPLATALLISDVMTNRQSGVKVFLSVITAPIVLAHPIDFSIRCYVNPQMFKYSSCKFVPPCLFKI
jgi:hypothetical protein